MVCRNWPYWPSLLFGSLWQNFLIVLITTSLFYGVFIPGQASPLTSWMMSSTPMASFCIFHNEKLLTITLNWDWNSVLLPPQPPRHFIFRQARANLSYYPTNRVFPLRSVDECPFGQLSVPKILAMTSDFTLFSCPHLIESVVSSFWILPEHAHLCPSSSLLMQRLTTSCLSEIVASLLIHDL